MTQDPNTKLLHDFLQMTDNIPPQVFFAYTAMLAVKQAQNQMAIPLEALRSQNAALTMQISAQQAGMQQLSAQYKTLIEQDNRLDAVSSVQQLCSEKDATWTDPKTGLMWSRISIGQQWQDGRVKGQATKMTWSDANEACATLHLAGFNDWRLPSREELESLMVKDQAGYNAPDEMLYPPDLSWPNNFGWYWSVSPIAALNNYAWVAHFEEGKLCSSAKYHDNQVRAVRTAQ